MQIKFCKILIFNNFLSLMRYEMIKLEKKILRVFISKIKMKFLKLHFKVYLKFLAKLHKTILFNNSPSNKWSFKILRIEML